MPDRNQATVAARRGSLPVEPEPIPSSSELAIVPSAGSSRFSNNVIGEGTDAVLGRNGRVSRLDHIFAMISILDTNDERMLSRLESELSRVESEESRNEERHLEHDIDRQIESDLFSQMNSASRREDLQQLLYALADRSMTDAARSDRDLNITGTLDRHEQNGPDDDDDDEDDDELQEPEYGNGHHGLVQLLLPDGSTLTQIHVDVIHYALENAQIGLHLVGVIGRVANRRRDREQEEPGAGSATKEQEQLPQADERRSSNVTEPDRERDEIAEQIEGYEGDRIERQQADERRNEQANQETDPRLADIMNTLKEFSLSGLGAEELDDFVLQAVLHLRGGPTNDNGGTGGDHIGDEQMRLYQECIAVIDDFLDLVSMLNDEENAAAAHDDDDDPNNPDNAAMERRHQERSREVEQF